MPLGILDELLQIGRRSQDAPNVQQLLESRPNELSPPNPASPKSASSPGKDIWNDLVDDLIRTSSVSRHAKTTSQTVELPFYSFFY